ncbi:MAG: flagellar protein [Lachnospiraceae bacterium]|nr:flagellar protein [Lachnospiraceae bacterium]
MDVQNCRGCGRLFNYFGGPPLCQACKDELEKKFVQVKEYLREKPNSPIQQVADDNGVSTKQIKQWVREERLTFSDDSPVGIECELCGATIKTGRFCENCKNKIKGNLDSVTRREPEPDRTPGRRSRDNKMRFLQ